MVDALSGFRQKVSRVAGVANAVKRLHDTGIIDLPNLGVTLQTMKNSGVYGARATITIQGSRKYPALPAVVDERGTLTYKQVDDMSAALAHGLQRVALEVEEQVAGIGLRQQCQWLGVDDLVLRNTGVALQDLQPSHDQQVRRQW